MSQDVSKEEQHYLTSLIAARYESGYDFSPSACEALVREGRVESCMTPAHIQQLHRPCWDTLFPNTRFYQMLLVRLTPSRAGQPRRSYLTELAIVQDEQLYRPTHLDQLLLANGIVITETNQATLAQALAAMSIPSYIGAGEIYFAEGEGGEWWWAGRRYNYRLPARLQNTQEARWAGDRSSLATFYWYFSFDLPALYVPTRVAIEQQRSGPLSGPLQWEAPILTEVPLVPIAGSALELRVLEALQPAMKQAWPRDLFLAELDALRAARADKVYGGESYASVVSIALLEQPAVQAGVPELAFYLVRIAFWRMHPGAGSFYRDRYEDHLVAWQSGQLYLGAEAQRLLAETGPISVTPDTVQL